MKEKDFIDKYMFRIIGPVLGFGMSLFPLDLLEKPSPEIFYENKNLVNKIEYSNQANNYLKKIDCLYIVSLVDLKRDSLEFKKKDLQNTFEYQVWEERERKRKGNTALVLGFGLLGGFVVGNYFDRKKLKKNEK